MERPILVTGGAGYVGSHTCKILKQSGFLPVVYDNLVNGHRDAVKWGPFIQGDILDQGALRLAFEEYAPVAVVHFAAHSYVGESVLDPQKYYRNNFGGTSCLLDAMLRADVKTIVFSSTCATYGIQQGGPISEDLVQSPINPYGRTKLMIEHMLQDYGQAYGLRYAALRYFNASGADAEGEIGERHDPETHLIPRAIMAALGEIPYLEVFGDDYETPDGTCLRDYVHVEDLAQAHILALDHLLAGRPSLAVNLGTGHPRSVKEIVAAVEKASGKSVPVRYARRRAGDPPSLYADPAKALELLGFEARYSRIDDIVKTAWAFRAGRHFS